MGFEVTDFSKDVVERSHEIPVVVDFWAEWCGSCRMLGPVLEGLAEQQKGRWALVKVNTEEHQDIAAQFRISSIPAVKLFVDGQVAAEFAGTLPERMIVQWLDKNIPNPFRRQVEQAKALIDQGAAEEAKGLLEKVIVEDPENAEANLLLARVWVFREPGKALQLTEHIEPGTKLSELAEAIQWIGKVLEAKEQPDSFAQGEGREKYLSAIDHLANERFDEAVGLFIEVMQEDRAYDNDGARKACIAIFKLLGEENETTRKRRRVFGAALYA